MRRGEASVSSPIDTLLADDRVTEVMINGPGHIFVERDGVLEPTDESFSDVAELCAHIDRLLDASGRRLDSSSPIVDARLLDGSRLNAVLAPVAVDGPLVTIRRAPQSQLDLGALVKAGSLDGTMAAFLHAAVLGRCNMVISGGAGAGKTTLLAALGALIPQGQRVVTIEDTAELCINHSHVVSQECRPSRTEGDRAVTLRDLVHNSVRMRPDRLIVGEVRGAEAADMVAAMNTGHDGSMTTLHANSADDVLPRLEGLLASVCPAIGGNTLREWLTGALDVVVHCERGPDGLRRVSKIAAVEAKSAARTPLMSLFERCPDDRGFRASGNVPGNCLARMARRGVVFPPSLFRRPLRAGTT